MTFGPPSSPPLDRELAVAEAAATAAGEIVAAGFERPAITRRNGRHDVLSAVDEAAERVVVERLRATFPDDAIVAEESLRAGTTDARPRPRPRRRTWLVDPLDGTVNHVSGIPFLSVSICLLIDGRPAVGVVRDPIRDETFVARSGAGARIRRTALPDRPLRVRRLGALRDAVVAIDPGDPDELTSAEAVALERLRSRVRATRTLGSAALSLAWVGAGRLDGFVRPAGIQPLDVMAGALVAAEAGALIGVPRGDAWPDVAVPGVTIGIVAAQRRVHAAVVGLFRAAR
jgi:fructose-1,6-bisphosphatase/inositol monophosphatase family enzyme